MVIYFIPTNERDRNLARTSRNSIEYHLQLIKILSQFCVESSRGVSRNPGRGVLTRMLSMNGVWSCMQLVGRSLRRLGSAQLYRVDCMINFSSADASELHLFFDRAQV